MIPAINLLFRKVAQFLAQQPGSEGLPHATFQGAEPLLRLLRLLWLLVDHISSLPQFLSAAGRQPSLVEPQCVRAEGEGWARPHPFGLYFPVCRKEEYISEASLVDCKDQMP